MIRVDDCKYIQNKRSNQLLKYKLFQDEEFEIIGYEKELLNNMEYGVIYKVKDNNGNEFNVRPKGDIQSRIDALKNIKNDIGKMLTVKFQNKSEDFVPRFPVGIGIRID
jgi:ATP-dependent DNA ligase